MKQPGLFKSLNIGQKTKKVAPWHVKLVTELYIINM